MRCEDPCFHCGEALGPSAVTAEMSGQSRNFCCHGCAAASELISGLGLDAYYRFRERPAERPGGAAPARDAGRWRALDTPQLLETLTHPERQGSSVMLAVD